MTVSTTESRIGYNGNGATTAFAFPYRFLESSDLTVILVLATGTQVTQVLNTNYTVTGAGDDAGGTVTMIVAPASGEQLVIVREVPLTQETDYISGDPFPSESHERALDKLTMISQRLESLISRSIRLSDADLLVTSTILPPPSPGSSLIWNLTGTALVNGVPVEGTLAISPFMEIVLGSADADEARTNILAAADAVVVKLTGAQTIADVKTFSSSPIVPTPTTNFQAATKAYADTVASTLVNAAVSPATLAPTLLVNGSGQSASGQAAVTLGSIPSWVQKITVTLLDLSPGDATAILIQIGDSGGIETTGYSGAGGVVAAASAAATTYTAGFGLRTTAAADVIQGSVTLTKVTGTTWAASGVVGFSNTNAVLLVGGTKALSNTLTQVQVATVSGTAFDAGTVNIMWE